MPKWMDDCVASYKKKHPDEDESHAWAVCTTMYKRKFGHAPEREDVIRPQLEAMQQAVGAEDVKLSFSDEEKRGLLQRAVADLYNDPIGYDGTIPWSSWYVTSVYDDYVVVQYDDRMYAIPYEVTDRHTVELGEPEEVVAAYVTAEAELYKLMLHEGWLPKGTTQTDLDDGDFAWLSFEYQKASADEKAKMNKRKHRKLPYKIHGKVSVEGWLAAWKAIRWTTYLRPSLRGGPDREAVMSKLKSSKPSKIKLDKEGHVSVKEEVEESVKGQVLYEGQMTDFLVEDATAEEKEKFALVFSGNVIPEPDTEHGVWSVNRRLYPPAAVAESRTRSQQFLDNGGVATVYTSHAAASHSAGRLPVGKVLGYSENGNALRFRAGIVETSEGADAIKLLEAGVLSTVSLRSYEWESHVEEVDGRGKCEIVDWCVIEGIDFATSPGLPGTQVTKEEEEYEMDLKELTLEELREQRPDLVAELVASVEPPETPEAEPATEDEPNDEQLLEMAILKAANTGLASVIAAKLRERVESPDQIDDVLEEARREAVAAVYSHRQSQEEATNLRGSADPAPKPKPQDGMSDVQRAIIENAGGEAA